MATAAIDLNDFTCSICREIFEDPVNLSCQHCYCKGCLIGLKKPSSSTNASSSMPSKLKKCRSLIYIPTIHEMNECFVCAICRVESFGYTECRDIQADLRTIETSCPNCSKQFLLFNLRTHLERCTPQTKIGVDDVRRLFNNRQILQKLSKPQAEALKMAQSGPNRSTFPCPYCFMPNFTVETMCQHIEEMHLDEDHRRPCTICPRLPWGDANHVSENVYLHIDHRHRFNIDTFVNFEQNEEAMMAEAINRSMHIQ